MGLLDSLNTGKRGLAAASAGISVVSNNVANANTIGYSRRSLTTATADPVEQAGVLFGQGVDVTGIVRAHDRYLGMRIVDAVGMQARSNTTEQSLRTTESWFNETSSTGLVEVYSAFYDTMTRLTQDPSDLSLRLSTEQAAERMTTTVSRTADGLTKTIDGYDQSFSSAFQGLNATLDEIAKLNSQIGHRGDTTGNTDLLDRRDQLVRELATISGATVELEPDGQATVYYGGHAAVSGSEARDLSIVTAVGAAPIVYLSADAGVIDITNDLGGQMGGLVDARGYTSSYLNRLDDFAFTLATSINAIHAAGFDGYGAAGGNLFAPPAALAGAAQSMAVDPLVAGDANLIALSGTAGGGVGDQLNLQNMLNFETNTAYTGGLTGLQFLSSLTSDVGSDVAAIGADADAQDALVEDFDAMRDSTSGVDSDEEAIRLVEYQAAYRASARVISAADEMLRVLTSLGA